MVLKLLMVRHLTNFWSFLTKSTTFLTYLTLKHKNEIKILFKNTCDVFNPKTRKWAENELWWNNRQTFGLFFTKSTTFLRFLTLKQKRWLKFIKKNTCVVFNSKTRKWAENELWWNIRQTFCLFWPKVPLSWDSWH